MEYFYDQLAGGTRLRLVHFQDLLQIINNIPPFLGVPFNFWFMKFSQKYMVWAVQTLESSFLGPSTTVVGVYRYLFQGIRSSLSPVKNRNPFSEILIRDIWLVDEFDHLQKKLGETRPTGMTSKNFTNGNGLKFRLLIWIRFHQPSTIPGLP